MTTTTVRAALGREVDVRVALRRDLLRMLLVLTWLFGALGLALAVLHPDPVHPIGADSHAYWVAWHRPTLYTTGPATRDAYLYSPAFAEVIRPFTLLPWPAFTALLVAVDISLLVWLLRPLGWRWALPLALAGLPEVGLSGIFIPMAVACVLGFRYPGAWAFPILTKITPGLGPVWFAVRREWRALAVSLGVTAAVAAVSVAIDPGLWVQWARFLAANFVHAETPLGPYRMIPLVYRAPVGVALVVVGARRGWRWTLPVAMVACSPVFWFGTLTLLAAIPRLRLHDLTDDVVGRKGAGRRGRDVGQ